MNLEDKYKDLLINYNNALNSYNHSLQIITIQFDEILIDTIKNGQIQKFETLTELAWKCCKLYIEINFGEIVVSPKTVYKQLFLERVITEDFYLKLIQTVEDRNMLSHIYKEKMFVNVYQNLNLHLASFKDLYQIINAT
jgi:nucleotidyltransferase substrate binding protein (TIGR01987 family)